MVSRFAGLHEARELVYACCCSLMLQNSCFPRMRNLCLLEIKTTQAPAHTAALNCIIYGRFLEKGVGLVTITMGEAGAYASYSSENCKISPALADQVKGWDLSQSDIRLPSLPICPGAIVNSNGCGDAFCAGIIVGLTWKKEHLTLKQVLKMGLLTGVHRADSSLRNKLPKVLSHY